MVKLVSTILRNVAGREVKPGEEFEVDDLTGSKIVAGGGGRYPEAEPADRGADKVKHAEPAKPKASTEVKPVSTQQAEQPQPGEYATRDLKAKG